jgi:3-methylcrotonyl-CoA carboxylase alpha subunit
VIASLLIANRGEIACRIIRTARRMGVRTVAVYSDADAKALHVREADEAVHIGPSPARESYLVGEKIIAAAKETGAAAIHPGYGFLSENAGFAQDVIDAGLVWVGPRPDSIRAMGLKDAAKKLMAEAGVPVTPGYLGEDQAPQRLQSEADALGYPVLIKAVAGGGGKGMRRVNAAAEFAEMLQSCKREAASSFGDERVLIEKYIERPRHIEVQVFGDTHGNVVHLFERDCSLQRRHQKVIEEAPAPGVDWAFRSVICDAAVKAAKAIDYVGAGTIEFIADASEGLRGDRVWFMEMNTRLQVEHPVTEEITGQDLVEWQLRVASGEPLPLGQEELSIHGWAMEARLYAENPATGFLPSTGRIESYSVQVYDARVDTGIEEGAEVSPFYDPMVAKLIVHGESREDARGRLASACDHASTFPIHNNAGFLARLLRRDEFAAGDVETGFIARHLDELASKPPASAATLHLGGQLLFHTRAHGSTWAVDRSDIALRPKGIWKDLAGFRANAEARTTILVSVDGEQQETSFLGDPFGETGTSARDVADGILVISQGWPYLIALPRGGGTSGAGEGDGAIVSPMPGRIIALAVKLGDTVAKGQKLLTLEAMKMEHSLAAPFDGIVAELNAEEGAQVSEGAMLARIEKGESQ